MNICCYDWFKNEDDWPKAGQKKIVWETQTRKTLGGRKVESWESQHAVLKEETATW